MKRTLFFHCSIIADILWRQRHYETIFVIGVVPMFLSFFVIAMLTHYEDYDPLLDFCKMVWYRLKALICCRRQSSPADRHFVERLLQTVDRQERESLINDQDHEIQSTSHENPLSWKYLGYILTFSFWINTMIIQNWCMLYIQIHLIRCNRISQKLLNLDQWNFAWYFLMLAFRF